MSTPIAVMSPDTAPHAPAPTPRAGNRGGPIGAVRRHPLVAFFVLAYAASWLAWLPYVLSADGLGVLDFRFPMLLGSTQISGVLPGAYIGPLGAALLVTAITGGRDGLRNWRQRLFRMRVGWYWYLIVLTGVLSCCWAAHSCCPAPPKPSAHPRSWSPPPTCPCSSSRC
jgi:hypothetical protein